MLFFAAEIDVALVFPHTHNSLSFSTLCCVLVKYFARVIQTFLCFFLASLNRGYAAYTSLALKQAGSASCSLS